MWPSRRQGIRGQGSSNSDENNEISVDNSSGTFIASAINSIDVGRTRSFVGVDPDGSIRDNDALMECEDQDSKPIADERDTESNKKIASHALSDSNSTLANRINDRTESNDNDNDDKLTDAAIEKLAVELSGLWKNAGENDVTEYKHDKDGNLIVQNQKYGKSQSMGAALEKIRARELTEMDAQEREAILNEVHGVQNRSVQETPSMVSSALRDLRREIAESFQREELEKSTASTKNSGGEVLVTKDAYRRGLELRSDFIQSDAFLLIFLRAELFDVPKAAQRYFNNLDVRHSFFGDEALNRPLFLTDLSKRELRFLKSGQYQLLPSRDRSGRRILAFAGTGQADFTLFEKFKVQFYLFEVMAQSEATQKLGFVYIGLIQSSGEFNIKRTFNLRYLKRAHVSMPIRAIAFHVYFPSIIFFNLIRAVIFFVFESKDRAKLQMHSGSQIEHNYHLSGFGISSGDIPMTYDGKVKTKNIGKFIRARNCIENYQKRQLTNSRSNNGNRAGLWNSIFSACPIIECPNSNNVVFGNKNMYEHPANVRLRHLMLDLEQRRVERIARLDETVTTSISGYVDEIIAEAQKQGLQFYAHDLDLKVYKEINDKAELHKKVLHVLRDVRKRTRGRISREMAAIQRASRQDWQQQQQQQQYPQNLGESSILGLDSYKRAKTDHASDDFCSC